MNPATRLALLEQRKLLKGLRKKHNITQEQLAKACSYSVSTISKFEQGTELMTERFVMFLIAKFPEEPGLGAKE